MRTLIATSFAALVAGALFVAAPFVAAPVAEADQPMSVTGGFANDLGQSWTIHAKEKSNGAVDGYFKSRVGDIHVEGSVACIDVVDNRAYVTGVVTRFDPDPTLVGLTFVTRFTDDGEGNSSADSHAALLLAGGPLPCDDPEFQAFFEEFVATLAPERMVTSGNIQVRD